MTDPHSGDRSDFEAADRGLIGALEPAVVRDEAGRVVWDNDAFAFLAGDCPGTAHPGLWRQSRLCARQGLYQVTEGIYQVRGLDLSNMALVEGDTGVIVIDPLISRETAAAALRLYRRHRGDRMVTGVIYTHSHVDHFGGVEGALLADVYERLGFGAECGTWRNFYLTGARELRHGVGAGGQAYSAAGMAGALTIEQLFDAMAIRVNGPRAWAEALTIDWDFTDARQSYRMTLSNGALIHWPGPAPGGADLTLTLTRPQLPGVLAGKGLDGVRAEGSTAVLERLLGLLDDPDPGFAIVTP